MSQTAITSLAAMSPFTQPLNASGKNSNAQATPDVDRAAKEFEGVFVSEMLSHMFEGMPVDPAFGGGHGEEMFRGMLVTEYGKAISAGPGLGLSSQIRDMMIQIQQKSNGG
jgi:Rod binding domain-containing protein